jgi:hypothetical protein
MRRSLIRVLPLAVAVAAVMALLPGAAVAGTPAPVTFGNSVHVVSFTPGPGCFAVFQGPGLGCPIEVLSEGTGAASGAVHGSFTIVENGQLQVGPTINLTEVLTGEGGTITIGVEARFVGGTATTETVQGYWTLVTGSGSYADLHGTGTYDATVSFAANPHTISETLTGSAAFGAGS